jgi:activator of HSP90 ATPase
MDKTFSRRGASVVLGAAATGLASAGGANAAPAEGSGISPGALTIHQEVAFHASPERLYHALTDARGFDHVQRLSAAMASGAVKPTPPRLTARAGTRFSLFGGYISGRQIELTPGERIVQAWRSASWPPHIYSIASFVISKTPQGSMLVFDHTGFPANEADHLAEGWRVNYWEPLAKALK